MPPPTSIPPHHVYRLIAVAVPSILLILSAISLQITASTITSRAQYLQEINLNQQSYDEAASLNEFVLENRTSLEKMSLALPTESMMVSVIQDIESVIKRFDQNGTVKLSGQTPVRAGADMVIPITILVQLNPAWITQCTKELTDLPYIIQILTLDSQLTGDNPQTIINARLYVQEPFIGY